MKVGEDNFLRGFAAAMAALIREHDQPTMAVDICRCSGLTLWHFERAGVDSFDLKPLRKAFRDD
jgi:hypothetical protein